MSHMLSEFVVLFFLKGCIALNQGDCPMMLCRIKIPLTGHCIKRSIHLIQQILNDRRIVEKTVNVSTYAMVSLQDGLICIADALMNLIALTRLTFKLEGYLPGGLLVGHGRMDRQQPETWQAGDGALNAIGVADRLSQHLIATANAYHHFPVAMSTLNGLSTTVSA